MQIHDSRRSERYIADPPLRARLGREAVTIRDLGEEGVQLEHEIPLTTGRSTLTFASERDEVEMSGRVIWSRLLPSASDPAQYRYRSGFRVDEPDRGSVSRIVSRLVGSGRARRDSESLERKRHALEERAAAAESERFVRAASGTARTPAAGTRRILDAFHALERDPVMRAHWEALGAASLVRDPQRFERYREAVAVWEYLDHEFGLDAVARVIRTSRL
ncbi:MAG TPA: hypothetical protein VMS56_08600 [Thermoanaerobaculia bacterium]|nr:hypothetical protein [Thermoanaerobaculia bacterium]